MYNVSDSYKEQIRQTVRNPSYIKILFVVTDPDAINDSSLSDNGNTYWSDINEITGAQTVTQNYLTLEHNRGILDGTMILPIPDGEPQIFQGFVGSEVSDEDGYWTSNPTVTVDFVTSYFSFAGLSFSFDNILGDYPKSFNIKVYNDGILLQTIPCTPTSPEFSIEAPIEECNKIEIEAIQSNIPFRRFRMESLTLGIKRTFTEKQVSDFTWTREVDFINAKLPVHNFDFTIIDKDREYDPENPEGIYSYIDARQECSISLGYELNNGSIEWQPVSTLFSTGEIDVDSEAVLPTVAFKTSGILSFLNKKYDQGKYYVGGRSFYDLATDILTFANIPQDAYGNDRWELDPVLATYTSLIPLPVDNCNTLLQDIANACCCILNVDRQGYITIKPKNDVLNDFSLELSDIYSPPKTVKYPVLQGVDTSYSNISVGSTEQLATFQITGASSTPYKFTYDMATDVSATVSGLTIVGTPTYYAGMCEIVLTGTGTLTLNGKKIKANKISVSQEFNSLGDRCPIENPLITNNTHAETYAIWIGTYINRRIQYEFEDRGYPEVDVEDKIHLDSLYTSAINVDILSTQITFNGGISSRTKVLKE